jgi:DNA-directed RNA polymerase specialized sigma subunit
VLKRRKELIECNLPLAISQARMFYSRNRASHHTYMDMLQVASGGLAAGVDKYVGPYTTGFRGVLIGRILGDLIEANSETFVHFFPADKRRLYRIRKIAASLRDGIHNVDVETLAHELNKKEGAEGEELSTSGEIHHLVNAASIVSASSLPNVVEDDEYAGSPIERYPDDASNRPDVLLEERERRDSVAKAIKQLSLVDQKLLRLRGLDLSMMNA